MALTLRQAGEKLHHWHGGMDAVYAVGSYYASGKEYPDPEVIEEARDLLARDIPKAEAGMHGWTKRDAAELKSLVKFLDGKLRGYHRNGRPTFAQQRTFLLDGLEAQGWKVSSRGLKVPHATSPYMDRIRLWFKPQAIYVGTTSSFSDARSLVEDMRDVPDAETLVKLAQRWA